MLKIGQSTVEIETISTFRECKLTLTIDIDKEDIFFDDLFIVVFYNENAEDDEREVTEIKIGDYLDSIYPNNNDKNFDFALAVEEAIGAELDRIEIKEDLSKTIFELLEEELIKKGIDTPFV